MDDIIKSQSDKFIKAIQALKPKGKALLDFMHGADLNEAEISAPMETFSRFVQFIIAIDHRNNGQFSFEEAETIIEIDNMFRNFFEESELSTTLVTADEAYNRATDKMQSVNHASIYNQIMSKLHGIYADHLLANIKAEDLKYIEAITDELLTFIPSTKALSGIFGCEVNLGKATRISIIQIKKADIANTNKKLTA